MKISKRQQTTQSQMSRSRTGASVLAAAMLLTASACTPQNFAQLPVVSASPINDGSNIGTTRPPLSKATESFVQDDSGNQVDILVINDNSLSMYEEQTKLGERFSSFMSEIRDIDYHIGMTTTDLESPRFNQGGRLLQWSGTGSTVLTRTTPNAEAVFENTVKRQETLNCDGTILNCPASNELPFEAMTRAFEQKDAANAGFFRERAPLVVVVLSDEDQASDAPSGSTSPLSVVTKFALTFPNEKRLMVAGIIIKPGDLACQASQRAQEGGQGKGFFGTAISTLALLTGGDTLSICERDYARPLAELSKKMRRLVTTFPLRAIPHNGEVKIKFTPEINLAYKVQGNLVIFDAPPPIGTHIEVSYEE